jgi:hypothetical protein
VVLKSPRHCLGLEVMKNSCVDQCGEITKPLIVYPSREHKWRRYDCWNVIHLHFLNCDCLDIDWKSCTVYMGEMKGTSWAHFPGLYSDVSFVNA